MAFAKMRTLTNTLMLSRILGQGQGACCCGVSLQFVRRSGQKIRQPHQADPNKRGSKRMLDKEKQNYETEVVYTKEFLERVPQDDVWLQREYPPRQFTLLETLAMHREFCAPQMFDSMDGLVQFEADLDFKTKKKTKFMQGIQKTIVLPHHFEDGTENAVLAICKSQEEKELAEAAGAHIAGGVEIIKALEKKEIRYEDFNHLVCTVEMLSELGPIRKLLRDRFPNKKSESVSTDIEAAVKHFLLGKNYTSKKIREDTGRVLVNIGMLDMVDDLLVKNFEYYLEQFCTHRSPSLGKFIKVGKISVFPSTGEAFHLRPDELWPQSQRKIVESIPEEIVQEEEIVVEIDSDDESEANKAKALR